MSAPAAGRWTALAAGVLALAMGRPDAAASEASFEPVSAPTCWIPSTGFGWFVPGAQLGVDSDADGLFDGFDACPDRAEDRDSIADDDGCPEFDHDGDGLPDHEDDCPNDPENMNRYADDDGCPDQIPDMDGDGFADLYDECPTQTEDPDGFEDDDGCPDLDNDGDRVLDLADDCPVEAGPAANRGCPDADRDGDGVVDRADTCPDRPGAARYHGCREQPLAALTDDTIELARPLVFDDDQISPRSLPVLEALASLLRQRPRLRVQIEIWAAPTGGVSAGEWLAQARAESAVAAVVAAGIDKARVLPLGRPGAGSAATVRIIGLVEPTPGPAPVLSRR